MKKIFTFILSLILFMSVLSVSVSAADVYSNDGFSYSVTKNNTASIRKYDISYGTDVVIPEKLDGYNVTRIESSAFSETDITSVVLPSSLSELGEGAFAECKELKSADLGNGITELPESAFSECVSLRSVSGYENLTEIGAKAFYCCKALENLPVGNSVKTIGPDAFYCCTSIKSVVIPENVEKLNARVFSKCSSLENVSLPENISLGTDMFSVCSALTEFTFPQKDRNIPERFFYNCKSLKSVTLYSNITMITENAFYGCRALTDVYFHGTQEQWKNIYIVETGNDILEDVTVHFLVCTHSYTETVVAPTCEQGYTIHTCTVCGDSYIDNYVDAVGHAYGEWSVIKEPTETDEGCRKRVCSVCENYEEQVIPVLSKTKAGDVNGDGKVTASDARIALRISAGLQTPTDAQISAADVTGDGKITAADARKILRASAGLTTL